MMYSISTSYVRHLTCIRPVHRELHFLQTYQHYTYMVYHYFGIVVYPDSTTPQERYLHKRKAYHYVRKFKICTLQDTTYKCYQTCTWMYLSLRVMCDRNHNRLLQTKKCNTGTNSYIQIHARTHVPFPTYVSAYRHNTTTTTKKVIILYMYMIQ